ncbi:unnamed protein product [Adineta ricciae]|uniref:Uncharacterized protein n=1 Tax=Adineta ricciae TaxID=249248 RepID=A0A815LTN1_ADIRI|nr:unnamed protein product [Adineta ricciae]CAF1415017.1 unnamed protein product [Adineta ricciae]
MPFLIPILIFDLLGSIPIIFCNFIYFIMRCCVQPSMNLKTSGEFCWRLGTMTCFRFDAHQNRPQMILLMRIFIILVSFILRFMCFVIGASCSARFQSQCTAYAVIAGFAIVSSIIVVIVEFVHFFRLWNYNPTDNRNSKGRSYNVVSEPKMLQKTHRRHLRFIDKSLLNDENSEGFRHSRCKQEMSCQSQSLHHYLLYHSLEHHNIPDFSALTDAEKKCFIAFYQTTSDDAYLIAQNGFPYGSDPSNTFKDYLHLRKDIFFARKCDYSTAEAIICVQLNLGRVLTLPNVTNVDELNVYFTKADGQYDTVYASYTERIYLRVPDQIERWIITITSKGKITDNLDGNFYRPCV